MDKPLLDSTGKRVTNFTRVFVLTVHSQGAQFTERTCRRFTIISQPPYNLRVAGRIQKSVFTSRVVFWKRSIIGTAVVLGIALALAAGKSNDVQIPVPAGRTLPKGFDEPLPVRRIIQRACLDCHSEQTTWPWYSNIPLISRQIHDDVNNGRELMDLSHWSEYTPEEQASYSALIAGATSARVMPPPKYLWMHRDARLSSADLDVLTEWSRSRHKGGSSKP